ncbi:TRAF3-interacting protein 1 isoform 1-T1 [Mantella aurantiaca]
MEAAVIRRTQETLGKVIRKPPLTDKLLGKPPFRYLHDILSEVIRTTGFLKGLYTDSELKSDNVKDKDSKISFLQKAIDVVVVVTGEPLSVKPARIVAGHEPEKTNEFLQALGKCCLNKLSSDDAVKRVLSGEKLEPKGKPPSSTKSQDKENREAKDEERRSQREKEERREPEIRERSGSRDRKDRQQLKDEERKHSERERKKEREKVGETEKDGLREGEKNDREKNRVKDSRSETDKERHKEKGRDRERRSEGSHGKERDRTRDKEKVREREHEKERNLEKEREPEDRSRERDRDRGDRNRDERTRTREQDKERRRERDSEREKRKERVKDNEHQGGREEKPEEEVRSERKLKTSEESTKKTSDISARESKHDTERELSVSSKAARPSASKLRERRPAKLGGEGDSASDGEGDAQILNPENSEASDVQTNLSAQRRIPRPGSARPAPPRVKRQPSTDLIVPERVSSGKGVSSVIVEKQRDDGDDDNEFVVEEASPQLSDMPAMDMESQLDLPVDEKHGSLVKKILETKKDYETQPDAVSKDKSLLTDNGRKKEKDMVTKEIEKLRSSIQILCRSALPLGKIMDYIQEDMDTMQNELQMWRKENGEHAEVLLREQSITDSAVEPLKAELAELEQLIKEQRDRICTVKGNILRNEEKIQKMVQSMSGSNRD